MVLGSWVEKKRRWKSGRGKDDEEGGLGKGPKWTLSTRNESKTSQYPVQ